jgi:hypothetical protein
MKRTVATITAAPAPVRRSSIDASCAAPEDEQAHRLGLQRIEAGLPREHAVRHADDRRRHQHGPPFA